MKKCLPMLLLILVLAVPASALEIEAPAVPEAGRLLMPEKTESFQEGLGQLFQRALSALYPDLREAGSIWVSLLAVVLLISLLELGGGPVGTVSRFAGAASVGVLLLGNTNAMIRLAEETVLQISDYGKLLLPVMSAALAAQGGVSASGALYAGTMFFSTLLSTLLSGFFVGGVYLFLTLSLAAAAMEEDVLKRIRDTVKNTISWCLKTILTVYTTYMSITGVVSGTTDAAALKAMKVTISSVVPVVGGILSDASESVLVSAAVMKNAAGIYGIFAVLSLFLGPFLKIGVHYLLLKASAMVCGIFGSKPAVSLIEDFSAALGLLLAVTGGMCLLMLISTVCFLKGVGS